MECCKGAEGRGSGFYTTSLCSRGGSDPVTGRARHDRSDHNHHLKRIAQHFRDGGYTAFDYEAFADVLADPLSGLTHAALVGKRRQSVKDAERLLSYNVVRSLERLGKNEEAAFIWTLGKFSHSNNSNHTGQKVLGNKKFLHFPSNSLRSYKGKIFSFSRTLTHTKRQTLRQAE